jgi:hypothetical protein
VEQCRGDRIRLTVLGRQIVPAEDPKKQYMWWVIEQSEPILGPQPFDLLYARFDRRLKKSEAAGRDLKKLDDGMDSLFVVERPLPPPLPEISRTPPD